MEERKKEGRKARRKEKRMLMQLQEQHSSTNRRICIRVTWTHSKSSHRYYTHLSA